MKRTLSDRQILSVALALLPTEYDGVYDHAMDALDRALPICKQCREETPGVTQAGLCYFCDSIEFEAERLHDPLFHYRRGMTS